MTITILLTINFTLDFLFYEYYVSLNHTCYTCVLTFLLLSLSHLAVACSLLGGPDSLGFVCSGPEAWIEVEPSTEDQAFLSEQVD